MRDKLSMEGFQVSVTFRAVDLARLIAKIAYGYGLITFGPSLIDKAYVRPAILNQIDEVGRWVGRIGQQPPPKTTNIHELNASVENGEVYVRVRLFANYQTPEYTVVVGRAP